MKQKTQNERPPVPFEDLDAEWKRHIRCVNRWVDEYRKPEGEEASRLSRWYAERQEMRRVARGRRLGWVTAVCLAAGVAGASWRTAPAPTFTAFNAVSATNVLDANTLSIYMLCHE